MTRYSSKHSWLTACAIFFLALAVFIAAFDWDWLRGPVQRIASTKTERSVALGHLHVKLARTPIIQLKNVRIGNIAGAAPDQMISADQIDISIDLRSLFGQDIVLPHVNLVKPDINLLRLADGKTNWTFGKPGKPSEGTVKVLGLSIDKGQINYDDRLLDIAVAVQAATGPSQLNDSPQHRSLTTQLAFKGHYGKTPFEGTASTADVLSLQDTGKQFPLLTKFKLGRTLISADGSVTDLLQPSAIDAQLSVAGPDLAALYPAIPVALPSSPPYRFAGRFSMQGNTYSYRTFKGVIGKSDLAGDASFTARKPRPHLAASLKSRYLSLDDLAPLIGGAPNPSVAKKTADKPATPSVRVAADRVLPQKPFSLDKMNAMDADVTLDVKKLNVPEQLPLEDLYAVLKVEAGKLALAPLKLGVADGNIVARITLDGTQNPLAVDANIDVSHAKLAQLFPTIKVMKESDGAVGARVHLVGHGNSVASILATSDGTAQLAMSGGTVSNLMMEAIGLDGGEIIKFLVRGDQQTPIRCAGASFNVKQGFANSQVIVFDTGDTRVDGKGYVNMKDEQFDVLLRPAPKDRSVLALRVPVRLHGSFAKPGYSLRTGELLLRGGSAVALGFVNPLLAILPLIETGPGTNTDCAAVFRETASAMKDGKTEDAR